MNIRANTVKKYIQAVGELDTLLTENDGYIDAYEFTFSHAISAGTMGDLVKSGFLYKVGKSRYRRTNKAITEFTITAMLEKRHTDRGRTPRPDTTVQSSNDPTMESTGEQQSMELVPPVGGPEIPNKQPRPTVSLDQYKALERRVSQLEQLLIRRGVA